MTDNRPLPKKKLYHVRFTLDTIIAGKDIEDAKQTALREQVEILSNDFIIIPPEIEVIGRIVSIDDCPEGWSNICLPWGLEKIEGIELCVEDYL